MVGAVLWATYARRIDLLSPVVEHLLTKLLE
jgi:hypothetical protein